MSSRLTRYLDGLLGRRGPRLGWNEVDPTPPKRIKVGSTPVPGPAPVDRRTIPSRSIVPAGWGYRWVVTNHEVRFDATGHALTAWGARRRSARVLAHEVDLYHQAGPA